jgi:chromosome segregation ATPase
MPLDPDALDAAKGERKRERNRLAATKCRERKLQRIQALEVEVKIEQTTEAQLQTQMQQLRSDIERLEEVLREHRKRGCTDIGEMKPTKMRKM